MPTPDVDVDAILDALDRHDVEYVVIGGFAAELYDAAIPPTRDIDITPSLDPGNLARLANALNELDARYRVAGGPAEGVEIPGGVTVDRLESMMTATFTTSAGAFDICLRPAGINGFQDLASRRRTRPYGDRDVPVAALEDVIRSKEAAGREKDLLVLAALREHLARLHRLGVEEGAFEVPDDFDDPLPEDVQDDFDR
jgi:hypothetical protein